MFSMQENSKDEVTADKFVPSFAADKTEQHGASATCVIVGFVTEGYSLSDLIPATLVPTSPDFVAQLLAIETLRFSLQG